MSEAVAAAAPRRPLELLDDAVFLVRHAGARPLAFWSIGTVPFALALVFFLIDMRRSPLALERLGAFAWAMAFVYAWMKAWQARYAAALYEHLSGVPDERLTASSWLRLFASQARVQPTSFVGLPIASLLTLPFGWVYAFYQNVSVTDDVSRAAVEARRWPAQNHLLILLTTVCWGIVYLNVFSAVLLVPFLMQTLLGIETVISASFATALNSTTATIAWVLTYFCFAPVVRAAYVIRCFDGQSVRTGEDLRVALRNSLAERRL